jgi:trans-aconitate methyltransferase
MAQTTSLRQKWSPDLYQNNARFVGELASEAVEWLSPKTGEQVLDIGCGDGVLSLQLAQSGAEVTGLDFSPELVENARERGLHAVHGNAEKLAFDREFDAVFSNAALHWIRAPDAMMRGVYAALRPGGRFVGELAGIHNAAKIRSSVHRWLRSHGYDDEEIDPWFLPTCDDYGGRLERAGFEVDRLYWFARPVRITYPVADWIRTFGSPYLTVLSDEAERKRMLDEVTEELKSTLQANDGTWTVDYTRLRFRAFRPKSQG